MDQAPDRRTVFLSLLGQLCYRHLYMYQRWWILKKIHQLPIQYSNQHLLNKFQHRLCYEEFKNIQYSFTYVEPVISMNLLILALCEDAIMNSFRKTCELTFMIQLANFRRLYGKTHNRFKRNNFSSFIPRTAITLARFPVAAAYDIR